MRYGRIAIYAIAASAIFAPLAAAQMHDAGNPAAPYGMPVMDNHVYAHVILEQLEWRSSDHADEFAWDAQAWVGTDTNRLWLKSEGAMAEGGGFEEGKYEILYSRPISPFFDVQAGLRLDADSGPGRGWAAFGVQGLAPNFFEVSASAYASDQGRLAANFEGSFDLLLTQRLILQPLIELNLYAKNDPSRRTGSGLSDIESGLRLRYEISRKFAPYIGVSYEQAFGQTRRYAIADGAQAQSFSFVVGIRSWL